MKKKKEDVEYYKRAMSYLIEKKLGFVYSEDGEFLTLTSCGLRIALLENNK